MLASVIYAEITALQNELTWTKISKVPKGQIPPPRSKQCKGCVRCSLSGLSTRRSFSLLLGEYEPIGLWWIWLYYGCLSFSQSWSQLKVVWLRASPARKAASECGPVTYAVSVAAVYSWPVSSWQCWQVGSCTWYKVTQDEWLSFWYIILAPKPHFSNVVRYTTLETAKFDVCQRAHRWGW